MHPKARFPNVVFGASLRPESAALAIMLLLLFLVFVFLFLTLTVQPAQAQTYKVLYNFTGKADGATPYAGLTMDAAGNLYGTAYAGGRGGAGTVFRLAPQGSGWIFTPLYAFSGGADGAAPAASLVFGPDGSLYGTTNAGGNGNGTVFNLKPPARVSANFLAGWTETVLYQFQGSPDGSQPAFSPVTFDAEGNIYLTTDMGGAYDGGTVVKLTRSGTGGTESIIYSFTGGGDGYYPASGVVFDQAGNLYGTAVVGGDYGCAYYSCGTVFKLTRTGSGWTESTAYAFQGASDGGNPWGGVILDQSGYFYGTTAWGGAQGGGTAFSSIPWWPVLYSFTGTGDAPGSWASMTMDAAASLYGTTYQDGAHGAGTIFLLGHGCGGYWLRSSYDFTGGSDGANPMGSVVLDASGNVYGTTSSGGSHGYGVIFEFTPPPDDSSGCDKHL